MKVQLDSTTSVWGVTLPETKETGPSEGKGFFGVTAAGVS